MQGVTALRVHHEDAGEISSAALIRWSGPLAVASGAYMIVLPFVHPSDEVGVRSALWVPVHLLYFASLTAVLLALVGVLARQLGRAGRLGLVSFLAAFLGTAMMLLEGREHLFSPTFGQGELPGLWELIAASFVFSIGYILLGIAIARAGVLPRGSGVLLALGGPLVAFSPPIGILGVLVIAQALFGAGLAWAGYGLWTGSRRE